MHKYNKGKDLSFTFHETVEVEAEVNMSLSQLAEQISDDQEARDTLLGLLGIVKPNVDEDRPITLMLGHLIERSFELSSEDEELIEKLAKKYNYLP